MVGVLRSTIHSVEWRFKKNLLDFGKRFASSYFIFQGKSNSYFKLSIHPDCKQFYHVIQLKFRRDVDSRPIDKGILNEVHSNLYSCYVYFVDNPSLSTTITDRESTQELFDFETCASKIIGTFNKQSLFGGVNISSNGFLTVSLIFFYDQDDNSHQDISNATNLTFVQNFEDLFESEREADVVIKVKGSHFKSHRAILAARSKVFAAMLQHEMAEKQSGEIEIQDCDPVVFRSFLLFLYSGKSDLITADNVYALYYIGEKYAVEDLTKFCIRSMMQNICADSICDILELTTTYDETNLLEAATNFFCNNTEQIITNPKWTDFQRKHLELSNELLLKHFANLKK